MQLLLLVIFFSYAPFLQSEPVTSDPITEIEQVVQDLFDAMRAADGERLKKLFTVDATLQTIMDGPQDHNLRKSSVDDFASSVGSSEPGALDERFSSLTIHKDAGFATVWMDYNFYHRGEFSHCGVNSMNMVQTENGWKIFSIVDTRRKNNC